MPARHLAHMLKMSARHFLDALSSEEGGHRFSLDSKYNDILIIVLLSICLVLKYPEQETDLKNSRLGYRKIKNLTNSKAFPSLN